MLSPAVSPRRLTGAEEDQLVKATRRIESERGRLDRAITDREALVLEIQEAGARISDIADVLHMSRTTIHAMLARARER